MRRALLIGVANAALALPAYAIASPHFGLEWPYPQRLPDEVDWGNGVFENDHDCHSEAWWYARDKGGATFVRVGALTSATGFGGSPVYRWSYDRGGVRGYNVIFVGAGELHQPVSGFSPTPPGSTENSSAGGTRAASD